MKRTSLSACLLAALIICTAISCEKFYINGKSTRSQTSSRSGSLRDSIAALKGKIVYSAVEFPEGYDWRRDTSYGAVNGKIKLLCSGKELLSLNAGPGTGIVLSADKHHVVGGHLYTEGPSEAGTVYKKDGITEFVSTERELLKGICLYEGALYTLSQNASGEGFVLRKDWEDVFSRRSGCVHGDLSDPAFGDTGAFMTDGSEPYFVFFTGGGLPHQGGAWYRWSAGSEIEIDIPDVLGTVYDVRLDDGSETVVVGRSTAGRGPVLCTGDKVKDYNWTIVGARKEQDYRLFFEDGQYKFYGTFRNFSDTPLNTAHWSQSGLEGYTPWDCSIFRGQDYVSRRDGLVEAVECAGKSYDARGRWFLPSHRCVLWTGKGAVIAMSDLDTGKPLIWENGTVKTSSFNGFYSSVSMLE